MQCPPQPATRLRIPSRLNIRLWAMNCWDYTWQQCRLLSAQGPPATTCRSCPAPYAPHCFPAHTCPLVSLAALMCQSASSKAIMA